MKEALHLAVKVLSKTLDINKLSAEKIQIATLTRQGDRTMIKVLSGDDTNKLISEYEIEAKKIEEEKKAGSSKDKK